MSTSSSSLDTRSSIFSTSQTSPACSSSHKYDPVPIRLKNCIEVVAQVAAAVKEKWWSQFDKYATKETIPTLAHFSRENKRLVAQYLQTAKVCEEENAALDNTIDAYRNAFLYTRNSEDYALLPLFFTKLNRPEHAALSLLYLAIYQLEEGKAQAALKTLTSAKQISPLPLKIETILAALRLHGSYPQAQIDEILEFASKQTDLRVAIPIYKHVIAVSPDQFDAYISLCSCLKDPEERSYLLTKAAGYAESAGKLALAESFRKDAAIPVYPSAMTQENWANPAAFLAILPKPKGLLDFLAAPCPIYRSEGKTAAHTHIVVPLVQNLTTLIDGVPVTEARTLQSLDQFDKASGGLGCADIEEEILSSDVDTPSEAGFQWAVMTRDLLPGSRNKRFEDQDECAEEKGYEVPGFRDAVTCFLWEQRLTGKPSYVDGLTRCREKFDGYAHVAVGNRNGEGLHLQTTCGGKAGYGVGVVGLRKF